MDNDLQKRISDLESVVYNHTHRGYDRTPRLSTTVIDTKDFVSDTTIVLNDPVRVEIADISLTSNTSNRLNSDNYQGDAAGGGQAQRVGVPLGSSSDERILNKVTWYLRKVGTPTDTYSVYISADSAGAPTDTALYSSDAVSSASVSTTIGFITFTFSTTAVLTAGTTYWLVLKRDGATDGANFLQTDDGNSGSGSYAKRVAGVWSTNFSPQDFTAEYTDGANPGRVLLASSLDTFRKRVIGFAMNGATQGSNVVVKLLGVMDSFSGLTPGHAYYLQDDSSIATTVGTYTVPVGYALSSTELDILIQI